MNSPVTWGELLVAMGVATLASVVIGVVGGLLLVWWDER